MIVADRWAKQWIDFLNSRSLDEMLTLYDDNIELRSPFAKLLAGNGTVKGKADLRAYWTESIRRMPHIHVQLVDVYSGHMALSIHHRDSSGRNTIETMMFNDQDKVVTHSACLDRVR